MKEMNSLEMRLRSWELRHPSAKLKRRIFNSSRRAPTGRAEWSPRWLVPATACLLLTMALLHQDNGIHGLDVRPQSAVAMNSSNQTDSIQAQRLTEPTNSSVPGGSFDWTNHSGFTSSNASFLPGKVN